MASELVIDGTLLTSLATNAFFVVRMVIDKRKADKAQDETVQAEVGKAIAALTRCLPCGQHGERLSAVEAKVDAHAGALKDLLEENRNQHSRIFAILDDIRKSMAGGK